MEQNPYEAPRHEQLRRIWSHDWPTWLTWQRIGVFGFLLFGASYLAYEGFALDVRTVLATAEVPRIVFTIGSYVGIRLGAVLTVGAIVGEVVRWFRDT